MTEEAIILDYIPFTIEGKGLCDILKVWPGTKIAGELSEMLSRALPGTRPKTTFRVREGPGGSWGQIFILESRFPEFRLQAVCALRMNPACLPGGLANEVRHTISNVGNKT